jgi:hypothetical protein
MDSQSSLETVKNSRLLLWELLSCSVRHQKAFNLFCWRKSDMSLVQENLASLIKFMEGGAKIKGVGKLMQVSFQDKSILQAKAEQNMLVIQERYPEQALAARGEESAAL